MQTSEIPKSHQTADVVVIGGGVIGLSIARELALGGMRDVMLIERGSLGREASHAAAGILAPQAEADHADEFFQLACRSRDMYPVFAEKLHEETGIDIELDTTGTLYLGFNENDEQEIAKRYAWQKHVGLAVERLSPEEARLMEPNIAPGVCAALQFPFDVQVENRRLVSALINSNEQLGVRLLTGVNVQFIHTERGSVTGVETSQGLVSAPRVVVATGAWTSFLKVSNKTSSDIRIEPVRGQMICFEAQPQLTRHLLYSPRGYLVPRVDGRLLAGSTSEQAGFEKRVTASGVQSILSHALEISQSVSHLAILDTWSGLRPRAQDDLPVLGPCVEIAGLSYATGHYRNGILLAPITGELMAAAILEDTLPPLLAAFAPDRFDLMTTI